MAGRLCSATLACSRRLPYLQHSLTLSPVSSALRLNLTDCFGTQEYILSSRSAVLRICV